MLSKKTIIIISLILAVFSGNSQESIPYDSLKSNIGEIHFVAISEYIGSGDSGENVTWDFSSLNKTSVNEIRILVTDSNANEANYISYNFTSSSFQYIYEDSSKKVLIATKKGESGELRKFKRVQNYRNYPLVYGMEYKDSSLLTYYDSNLGDSAHNTTIIDRKIDGFGTLTTPLGAFNNVLRARTIQKVKIIYSSFNIEYEIEFYEWFVSGYSASLMTVNIINVDDQLTYSTTYLDDPNLQQIEFDKPSNEVVIYPNPTSDYVNISSNWTNISVEIYDITGRNVYEGNENRINVGDLERGLYTIVVMNIDNSNTYTKRIILER